LKKLQEIPKKKRLKKSSSKRSINQSSIKLEAVPKLHLAHKELCDMILVALEKVKA